jgi:hypothetical protein
MARRKTDAIRRPQLKPPRGLPLLLSVASSGSTRRLLIERERKTDNDCDQHQ